MSITRHVVLVTYGEPPTPSFVDQLTYSWRILLGLTRKVDAIPKPLLPVIALARARGRRQLWRAQDYGSPLEPITVRQARGLTSVLTRVDPGARWQVHVAYEYRHPLVGEAVRRLPAREPVWVVPLYAADSAFTHALTREATAGRDGATYVLGALAPHVLAEASAAHVLAQTGDGWQGADVALVLAAHGTVLNPPKPINTGREATEALCGEIRARLAGRFGLVVNGWLNHTRGGRWTEPPMDEALRHVVAAGFRKIVYFPYGFLGDNAESQLEGRIALEAVGSGHAVAAEGPGHAGGAIEARHLPCLNDAPALLELLARQIVACAATCGAASLPVAAPSGCARICQSAGDRVASCDICAAPRELRSAEPAA
jgi:protoheme ferro-lyase